MFPKLRTLVDGLLLMAAMVSPQSPLRAASVEWVCSTEAKPSQVMDRLALHDAVPAAPAKLRVVPARAYQRIEGFGACFNEMGWVALGKLPEKERRRVLESLFGDEGCAFTLARVPIGASDFAIDGYSLDDTPGDLELAHFSIARDERLLIPFIQAAQDLRPGLLCWASPWSPPAWMKDNGHYSRGSLRWEPAILRSYADYFARWIGAYRSRGIPIYAVTPQNEPNILNVYPTCLWNGEQLREFIADYLGPVLREKQPGVELWLGLNGDPFNDGENPNARLCTVLSDPKAKSFLKGIAFQYDSQGQLGMASSLYPELKLMQSETECHRGDNSWGDALHLYALMQRYLENGAGSYFAWNMVLDETGKSAWAWRQNALVTADTRGKKAVWNGEFHVLRHFSHFVRPGAHRVLSVGSWSERIAFQNPDGALVIIAANSSEKPQIFSMQVDVRRTENSFSTELPPRSVSSFVIRPE